MISRLNQRRYLLLGCETSAGNLGVAALGLSLVQWLRDADPDCEISLQMPGQTESFEVESANGIGSVSSAPLHFSRSLRARHGTRRIELVHAVQKYLPRDLGGFLSGWHPALRAIREADVVIDASAGDSFTEIYGPSVFDFQCGIKETVLALGRPLVMAPQTIGPFETESARARVRKILARCALVATRDVFGLDEIRALMGDELDDRFVVCPDMAFGLNPAPPFEASCDEGDACETIGINVSELLYFGRGRFGIQFDHQDLIHELIGRFLAVGNTRVLLVPHVLPHVKRDRAEKGALARSDVEACECAARRFRGADSDRIAILRDGSTAPRVKSAIGRCSFFVGARMHACIGALSQSVPTATLAYSKKVSGVMGSLGVPETEVDLRSLDQSQAIEAVIKLYEDRDRMRHRLESKVPEAKQRLSDFFDAILPVVASDRSPVLQAGLNR